MTRLEKRAILQGRSCAGFFGLFHVPGLVTVTHATCHTLHAIKCQAWASLIRIMARVVTLLRGPPTLYFTCAVCPVRCGSIDPAIRWVWVPGFLSLCGSRHVENVIR